MSHRFRLLSCAIALCLASPAALSTSGMAHGEPSLSPKSASLSWRGAAYRNLRSSEVRYDAMPAERLLQLQRRNAANGMKAPQIGIGRRAGIESRQARLPRLQWMGDSRGNAVARLRIASPDAMGLRVGLDVSRLPDGVELRWKQIGINGLMADPQLPFFIQWEVGEELHPSNGADGAYSLACLEIAGDPQRVSEWLGESVEAPLEDVKVEWVAPHGTPGIIAVQVQTPQGLVRL